MKIDFSAIEKLPLQQRVKRLKELEGEIRELIEQRRKEIQESEEEIQQAEEFLSRAEKELQFLEAAEVPQPRAVRAEELLKARVEDAEAETEAAHPAHRHRGHEPGRELEEITAEARIREELSGRQREYANFLAQQPVDELFNRLRETYQEIRESGVLTREAQDRIRAAQAAVYEKRQHGQYDPGQENEARLTNAERLVAYLNQAAAGQQYRRN